MRLLEAIFAPLDHSALEHRRVNAERRLKIIAERNPFPVPPAMQWSAIDEDSYDADCDERGFFTRSPVGHGATREAAIADLLGQLEAQP